MRNAYEPIPWLAALNIPAIKSATGLGTGGGASVDARGNTGSGHVDIYLGPSRTASGSIVLTFPSTPPTLFISGDEAFGPLSQSTTGNDVTISWTANTGIPRSIFYRIHYEWAVSQ